MKHPILCFKEGRNDSYSGSRLKKKKKEQDFSIPTYYTAEFGFFFRQHFNSQDTLCFGVSYLNQYNIKSQTTEQQKFKLIFQLKESLKILFFKKLFSFYQSPFLP